MTGLSGLNLPSASGAHPSLLKYKAQNYANVKVHGFRPPLLDCVLKTIISRFAKKRQMAMENGKYGNALCGHFLMLRQVMGV